MLIGFGGRLQSGKTMLGKICEKYGAERLFFALPLKQLCADILNVSIDKSNEMKITSCPIEFSFDRAMCEYISQKTNLSFDSIYQIAANKKVENVRELLQYLGTNIIRRIDMDWHVKEIAKMIQDGKDYVIDDVRYPNEKKLIDRLGGDCWYIVRPQINNISNHESETSLTFHHCWNKIIINNNDKESLEKQWDFFVQDYKNNVKEREKHIQTIIERGVSFNSCDILISKTLIISKYLFDYVPKDYNFERIESLKLNDDKTLFLTYKDGTMEMIENPLNIEELKKYL